MRRACAVLLFLSLVLLALPALASARTPGQWALVSPTSGESIATEAWLLRQADGSLLVTYANQVPDSESIFTSTISPAGDIGQGAHVVDGWASVSDPAVIHSGGGLQAFFGGIHTTDTGDPNGNLNYGTRAGAGRAVDGPARQRRQPQQRRRLRVRLLDRGGGASRRNARPGVGEHQRPLRPPRARPERPRAELPGSAGRVLRL